MDVIDAVISPSDNEANRVRLYALAISGLQLRNSTSLMNRITAINEAGVRELEESCH